MTKPFFKAHENHQSALEIPLSEFMQQLNFDENGLMPAITQQYDSREILMMAWMNIESIEHTLTTGRVYYWSRSRQKLWAKGECSGNIQTLKHMHTDCDGDTLLLSVNQTGNGACHTGRKSCFFWKITPQGAQKIS